MGWSALKANTTGIDNIAIGSEAKELGVGGSSNICIGRYAARNTTGNNNVAIGDSSLITNTSTSNNVAVGATALNANTTGASSTAIGHEALKNATTNGNNTAVGFQAANNLTTGQLGVFIGTLSGNPASGNITGYGNVCVGPYAAVSAGADNNEIVIGTSGVGGNVYGKGSATAFINANAGGTYNGANLTTWTTTSDQRLKKNIVDNNIGLDKINSIRVRNFEYRAEEEITDLPQDQAIVKTGVQLGVIAQELQAVLPECVKTESTGVMTVDADNLTWYMINAIKELKAEVDSLKSQLQGN